MYCSCICGTDKNKRVNDFSCLFMKNKMCKIRLIFVAEINQTQKAYMYISMLKTWFDAQTYCRTHHTDLTLIENAIENAEVYSLIPAQTNVWIGLYREPWTWSDQTRTSFTNWITGLPDNMKGIQHCATESEKHMNFKPFFS
uniref:C-type lectin domain-containing protein n=1 Tax=Sphaeramia orbicularis TaxID=375764 RepID=A0A672Y547_9TELE